MSRTYTSSVQVTTRPTLHHNLYVYPTTHLPIPPFSGVLIDSLNVEENLALSLQSAGSAVTPSSVSSLLKAVGLRERDRHKMAGELSGGMLRRATLAQVRSWQDLNVG